ncbi:uncharacterized protein [Manis javanica]|uniref:uncharacterized protein n=1 Tax=Manis javanica TaxID=9974 RepID=UPI003C6CD88B
MGEEKGEGWGCGWQAFSTSEEGREGRELGARGRGAPQGGLPRRVPSFLCLKAAWAAAAAATVTSVFSQPEVGRKTRGLRPSANRPLRSSAASAQGLEPPRATAQAQAQSSSTRPPGWRLRDPEPALGRRCASRPRPEPALGERPDPEAQRRRRALALGRPHQSAAPICLPAPPALAGKLPAAPAARWELARGVRVKGGRGAEKLTLRPPRSQPSPVILFSHAPRPVPAQPQGFKRKPKALQGERVLLLNPGCCDCFVLSRIFLFLAPSVQIALSVPISLPNLHGV